jgi:hypothetical protein
MYRTTLSKFSALLLLLWVSGCASPRGGEFNFDDPSSVVARAWQYIDQGYAHEEGSFRRDSLRLSKIDYSVDGTSVSVSFCVVASFKKDTSGHWAFKALDIEMDKAGKFVSASTADVGNGFRKPIF